jgi:UDP-N-acetyl-2-amino-2-deoxyglucuronate dehydrogenase
VTRFALIGAAGFVAPRHMQAIKDVGGRLVAALDPHDSAGVLDRFDRETEFFTDEYRFERFLEKQRLDGQPIDWLAICSPNYMHDRHIRMGLWSGAKVICEKPLVINPDNLDRIRELERSFMEHSQDQRVFTILQLRHVEGLKQVRARIAAAPPRFARLNYATPRGRWYHQSWKGDTAKSGGLIMNIGVHMFDLLLWLFGAHTDTRIRTGANHEEIAGSSLFGATTVEWRLSISPQKEEKATRWLSIRDEVIEFAGFENLHSVVYEETLAGRGHGIEDARPAIELVAKLR